MSMMTVILFGFATVGGLVVGALADRIGVPTAIAAGGCAVLCAAVGTVWRAPALLGPLEPAPAR